MMMVSKPIFLSDPMAGLFKLLVPFITLLIAYNIYQSDPNQLTLPIIIIIAGLAYWWFNIMTLKEVKLDGDYLIISNGLRKDRINIHEIEKLKIKGWPGYLTTIDFKHQTKFGQRIYFKTMTSLFYFGISDEVENILTRLKENINKD